MHSRIIETNGRNHRPLISRLGVLHEISRHIHSCPFLRYYMDEYICGFVRSPFTRAHRGHLKDVRPDDMAGQTANALLIKTGVDPSRLDDILVGCAYPEG